MLLGAAPLSRTGGPPMMAPMRAHLVLAPLLLLAGAAAQELTEERAAQCRDLVLPSADELEWRAIPWRDTLAAAVLEANEVDKPVLLWAMNGHPLGCT